MMDSWLRDFPGFDRLREGEGQDEEPAGGRAMPLELGPWFDQVGVTVVPDDRRGPTGLWSVRRPCTAEWRIVDGRLWLVDLVDLDDHGRRFVVKDGGGPRITSPLAPLDGPIATPPDPAFRERLLPGVGLDQAVFADWVDEELVLLEGEELFEFGGPFPDNFERNRVVRVEQGRVVRSWIRHHTRDGSPGPDDDPLDSPNWAFQGPRYPPTLGMRERYQARKDQASKDQASKDQTKEAPDRDHPSGPDPGAPDS